MKRCNGVLLSQGEEKSCSCLRKPLPLLGWRSTLVSGEQVCGSDEFKISLERIGWACVFL